MEDKSPKRPFPATLICLLFVFWATWCLFELIFGSYKPKLLDFVYFQNQVRWFLTGVSFIGSCLTFATAVALWSLRPSAFRLFAAKLTMDAMSLALTIPLSARTFPWKLDVVLPSLLVLGIQASICVYIWRITSFKMHHSDRTETIPIGLEGRRNTSLR